MLFNCEGAIFQLYHGHEQAEWTELSFLQVGSPVLNQSNIFVNNHSWWTTKVKINLNLYIINNSNNSKKMSIKLVNKEILNYWIVNYIICVENCKCTFKQSNSSNSRCTEKCKYVFRWVNTSNSLQSLLMPLSETQMWLFKYIVKSNMLDGSFKDWKGVW